MSSFSRLTYLELLQDGGSSYIIIAAVEAGAITDPPRPLSSDRNVLKMKIQPSGNNKKYKKHLHTDADGTQTADFGLVVPGDKFSASEIQQRR